MAIRLNLRNIYPLNPPQAPQENVQIERLRLINEVATLIKRNQTEQAYNQIVNNMGAFHNTTREEVHNAINNISADLRNGNTSLIPIIRYNLFRLLRQNP